MHDLADFLNGTLGTAPSPQSDWTSQPPAPRQGVADVLNGLTARQPGDEDFYARVRRRKRAEEIAGEEMENYAGSFMQRGLLPGARPSDVYRERLTRELPDITPEEVETAGAGFDAQAPQAVRAKQFRDIYEEQRRDRYLHPTGQSMTRAVSQEMGRLTPFVPTGIAQNMGLGAALGRMRAGTETDDDRTLIANHLLDVNDEAGEGPATTAWKAASGIPSTVLELEAAGGMAKNTLTRVALQGLAMAPAKFAANVVPGVTEGPDGLPVVGPPKDTWKEAGKAAASGLLEAGVMHGVGQVGKVLRGGESAAPGLLERAGVYGVPEALVQGRVSEGLQYATGLSESPGLLADLASGDPARQKRALAQLAGEAAGVALAGGAERLHARATAAVAQARAARGEGYGERWVQEHIWDQLAQEPGFQEAAKNYPLVPYQGPMLPAVVPTGQSINTPGPAPAEPDVAGLLPGPAGKPAPPEPEVDLHQPPGGWVDPAVARAMAARRAGLNVPFPPPAGARSNGTARPAGQRSNGTARPAPVPTTAPAGATGEPPVREGWMTDSDYAKAMAKAGFPSEPATPQAGPTPPPAAPPVRSNGVNKGAASGTPALDRQVLKALGDDVTHEMDLQQAVEDLRKKAGQPPPSDEEFAASVGRLRQQGRVEGGETTDEEHEALPDVIDGHERDLRRHLATIDAQGRKPTREEAWELANMRGRIDNLKAIQEAGPGQYYWKAPGEAAEPTPEQKAAVAEGAARKAAAEAQEALGKTARVNPAEVEGEPEWAPQWDHEEALKELDDIERRRAAAEGQAGNGGQAELVPGGGRGSPPLRRPFGQNLSQSRAAAEVPAEDEAAQGDRGAGAPAAAGGQAGGDELGPRPSTGLNRPAPAPAEVGGAESLGGREWLEVRQEARRRLEFAQEQYEKDKALHLELRKELAKYPGNPRYPSEWQKIAHQDANSVKGLDEIAERLSRQNYEGAHYVNSGEARFGRDPIEARDNLFEFLTQPLRQPPTFEQFEARVRDERLAEKEQARREAEEGRGDEPEGAALPAPTEVEPGVNFFFGGAPGRQMPRPPATPPRSTGLAKPPGEGLWGKAVSLGRALKSVFNPAAISETSQATAGNLRERLSMLERLKNVAAQALDQGKSYFDRAVVAEKDPQARAAKFLAFTDPYEAGQHQALPPQEQAIAAEIKRLKDEVTAELAKRGLLQSFIDNHLGHLWRDPNAPGASAESLGARVASRRPMEGAQGFKKQRQLPTWRDGIDAGLEPATWNSIEAELSRLGEMYKAIAGHDMYAEEKAQGRMKYVPLGASGPQGWKPLDDRAGRVFAPPTVDVKEYFDAQQMKGLEDFAHGIGAKLSRVTSGLRGAAGMQVPGKPSPFQPGNPGEITTAFGTPEYVLAHEIGHEIDSQYPQLRKLLNTPALQSELEVLARLRSSNTNLSAAHQAYLQKTSERIANLVAAYVHAPELLGTVAPGAKAVLENFLQSTPRLADLTGIKPSLELGEREQAQRVAGPQLVGQYWVPAESATLIDRYLEPGLQGTVAAPIYNAWMGAGNEMNKLSLGVSAFHALMTAGNSQATALDVALRQVLTGKVNRSTAVNLLEGTLPGVGAAASTVHDFLAGHRMSREWFRPGSQGAETAMLLEQFMRAGGRARMGSDYNFDAIERFKAAVRQRAGVMPVLGNGLRAVTEALAYPIMQQLVPKVKMGSWARMARFELERLGPNASVDQQRQALYRQWQSVENRFGQMTYDNLFWNRTFRDILHATVRSVGWNTGSLGEFGGAVADLPSTPKQLLSGQGVSPRVSYAVALAVSSGLQGAMLQYLLTGKGPEEVKDLYFPKTGRTNPDGTPERLSSPSYAKDVASFVNRGDEPFAYPENVGRMAKGKAHPLAAAIYEAMANEDWSGAAIRDPKDPLRKQAADEAEGFLGHFVPISVLQQQKQRARGAGPWEQAAGYFGYTSAPSYINRSWEQQRQAEQKRKMEPTPLEKKRLEERRRSAAAGLNVPGTGRRSTGLNVGR